MDKGGVPFQSLGDVWQKCLAQQQGHGSCSANVAGLHRIAFCRGANNDFSQSLSQIGIVVSQHQNGHDFTGCGDVKPVLTDMAVGWTAHPNNDVAQRPIVHVDDPRPRDSCGVKFAFVAVLDVVVDEG